MAKSSFTSMNTVLTSRNMDMAVRIRVLKCDVWSTLLMTFAISFPLWSSVYKCQRVECAFTFPERTACVMSVIYAVLYVHGSSL